MVEKMQVEAKNGVRRHAASRGRASRSWESALDPMPGGVQPTDRPSFLRIPEGGGSGAHLEFPPEKTSIPPDCRRVGETLRALPEAFHPAGVFWCFASAGDVMWLEFSEEIKDPPMPSVAGFSAGRRSRGGSLRCWLSPRSWFCQTFWSVERRTMSPTST